MRTVDTLSHCWAAHPKQAHKKANELFVLRPDTIGTAKSFNNTWQFWCNCILKFLKASLHNLTYFVSLTCFDPVKEVLLSNSAWSGRRHDLHLLTVESFELIGSIHKLSQIKLGYKVLTPSYLSPIVH